MSQQQPPQKKEKEEQHIQCDFHPCRLKYFCIDPDCTAPKRAACGECYTESPHQQHKIIQNDEYESTLKQNYQKVLQQCGTVESTQSLIQKAKEQFKKLKEKIIYSIDQAESHVIREITSKQDVYETEKFKTLYFRIKQLKNNFFYGGAPSFDKTIGDFSLKLYNMDEDLINYLNDLKIQRETYIQPFQSQFQEINTSIDNLIQTQISPMFDISPPYPQNFVLENFQGIPSEIKGHESKFTQSIKFIHNQTSQKSHQIDSKTNSISEIQNFVFTCAQDSSIRLWNLGCDASQTTPSLWKTYLFENKKISAITQLNYQNLLSAQQDGTIQIWDVRDASCIAKFSHTDKNNINFQNEQQQQQQDEINTTQESQENLQLINSQKKLAPLPNITTLTTINESLVIAGYLDGELRIWDAFKGLILKTFNFHENNLAETKSQQEQQEIPRIVKINQWILASIGSITKLKDGDQEQILENSQKPPEYITIYKIVVWDWRSGQIIGEYTDHQENKILDLQLVGENTMVSCDISGQIHAWDTKNCNNIKIFENQAAVTRNLVTLSDEMFASSGDDLILRIWNINEQNCVKEYNQLAPQNEQEQQLQNQKPNQIVYIQRISENQILTGSVLPPYMHIWN